MTKEEKKELNKKLKEEQRNLEKEFHKTPGGKLMKVFAVIVATVFVFGLLLMCAYHIFDLNQNVQSLASHCIEFGGESAFFIAIIYCVLLPSSAKEDKEKANNKQEKNK